MKNKFFKIVLLLILIFTHKNSLASWGNIGTYVTYNNLSSSSNKDIAIIYSGCGVSTEGAENWAIKLYDTKLKNAKVGHVFAVSLPSDGTNNCSNSARTVKNSEIIKKIDSVQSTNPVDNIYIIAHSSGAFAAADFLKQTNNNTDYKQKITLFNLDGDNSVNNYKNTVKKNYAVVGKSGTVESLYYSTLSGDEKITLDLPSGCATKFCVHMRLINKNGGSSSVDIDYKNVYIASVTNEFLNKLSGTTETTTSGPNTSTTIQATTQTPGSSVIGGLDGKIDFTGSSYKPITKGLFPEDGISDTEGDGVSNVINLILKIFIALAGALAVVMIIVHGLRYMGSSSVWGKGESKSQVTNALLGLVLLLTSYLILYTINPDLVNIKIGINKIKNNGSKGWEFDKVNSIETQNYDLPPSQGGKTNQNAANCPTKELIRIPSSLAKLGTVHDNICKEFADKMVAVKEKTKSINWIITSTTDGTHQSFCHKRGNSKSGSCADIAISGVGPGDESYGTLCEALKSIPGIDFLNEGSNNAKCQAIHQSINTKYGTGTHLHVIFHNQ